MDSITFPFSGDGGFLSGPAFLMINNRSVVTVNNPTGFQGITFFNISSNSTLSGGFTFDNIAVTPIPEPAAFTLVAVAFAAMVIRRFCRHTRVLHSNVF